MAKMDWRLAAKIAGVAAGAYGATLATVWAAQEKLLFKPDPFTRQGQRDCARRGGRPMRRRVVEWEYEALDGMRIQGFVSLPRDLPLSKLEAVVYLGGVREEASWTLERAGCFEGKAFICMNYRGYGMSQGKPSQEQILRDCAGALEMLIAKGWIDRQKLCLIGRSLGSGVAGYLAHKVGARKVCLVTPYDSVLSVARGKYWYLPLGMMMRHPFDALPWARANDVPMLMLLAEKDSVVPHGHSRRLFQAWGGSKREVVVCGTNHSSVVQMAGFFESIASFFDEPPEAQAEAAA
jgi:pimeloyl-ACP methyl ester carboxylesterase